MQTVVPGDVFCIVDNTKWMTANKSNKANAEDEMSMT